MDKIVKEVEIAGVKHSITLADDMVGQGLKKDENGVVNLRLGSPLSKDVVPVEMSHDDFLVLKYGTGLTQRDGFLTLNYGTGIQVDNAGTIWVNSNGGHNDVSIDAGRSLYLGSQTFQIGTDANIQSNGIFNIKWEPSMNGIELRISSESAGIYLNDGSLVLGGLTLSSKIKGLRVSHTIDDVNPNSGFLNIILREGSDILFVTKDRLGNIYQGSVALTKK